ncbi:hypothetical protein J437_LFUL004315 [Ladona fulva]|uniref:U1 small nuclear ribonucleoprotein of 70kDa N-terminal domain-containing protein n=1 Tax=Ladona fulva TaxID=123851 RepID=A0A8K0NYD5_LADFU|nr:hypothetical protein J437_LFUL004315 [Ladona fulva]
MTQFLPPNLLALFAPRDPIPFLPPVDKLPHEKKNRGYTGVGDFLSFFEDPKDTPPPTRVETREERLERRRREKAEQVAYKLEQEIAVWDPHGIATATGDPFKTLFVARINYDTSESKLRREFEVYGAIKKFPPPLCFSSLRCEEGSWEVRSVMIWNSMSIRNCIYVLSIHVHLTIQKAILKLHSAYLPRLTKRLFF